MSLLQNAVSVLLVSAVGVPAGIVTSILLARYLSVADRGSYSVAITFLGLVTLFSQLGWSSASIYRLRRVRSEPAQVATAALVASAVCSLSAIGLCLLLRDWLWQRFFAGAPPEIFVLTLVIVPFQLVAIVFTGIARGIDRFRISNAHQMFVNLGSLVALILVLVVYEGNVTDVLIASLAVQVVAALGLLVAVVRHTGISTRIQMSEIRPSLVFGLKSYVQSLAGQLHERIDVFMIAYFLADPTQVAFYAVAAGVIRLLKLVPEAVGKALFPRLAEADAADSGILAARVLRHSTLWVGVCVVGLGVLAPLLIPLLYGHEYELSIPPFLLLLPGMALLSVYQIMARYFVALGRQHVNIYTQLFSLFVNVSLNVVLIPRYGIVGAAAASLVSYGLEALLITIAFTSHSGRGLRESFIFHADDIAPYRRRLAPLLRRWGIAFP